MRLSRPKQIRVLIADDHPLVRMGMEVVLQTQPDLRLVAQASDGEAAIQLARLTRPDVVVLDMRMPIKDGLAALPEIKEALPAVRCLMLTSFDDSEQMLRAIKLGAAGFLMKDSGTDALLSVIRAIHRGDSPLHPATARELVKAYQEIKGTERDDSDLTSAEVRVLRLLTRGLSNQDLANELNVSVRTITTHIRHILDKLALENRVQAALYARDHGLTM